MFLPSNLIIDKLILILTNKAKWELPKVNCLRYILLRWQPHTWVRRSLKSK